MKVFCQTCKEYVLDTSDKFVIGGPYNGAMFQAPSQVRYHVDAFMFAEWVEYGNLFCPRCTQGFIIAGVILTEHGLIKEGQGSIDTDFSVIHADGELKNQLMWADKWSREGDFKGFEPPAEVSFVRDHLIVPDYDDLALSAGEATIGPGTFGEQVKEARMNLKLSRKSLGLEVRVSESTIKSWEKDKTKPSKKNLKKLKQALGI